MQEKNIDSPGGSKNNTICNILRREGHIPLQTFGSHFFIPIQSNFEEFRAVQTWCHNGDIPSADSP